MIIEDETDRGGKDNPIRYSGYQYDEETGLYYLNARMYDPVIARFMQEDTYRGEPNDPLSLNLYTYCQNEPIMYWDPSGHADAYNHMMIGYDFLRAENLLSELTQEELQMFLLGTVYPDFPYRGSYKGIDTGELAQALFYTQDGLYQIARLEKKYEREITAFKRAKNIIQFVDNPVSFSISYLGERIKGAIKESRPYKTAEYWFWQSDLMGQILNKANENEKWSPVVNPFYQSHYGENLYWHSTAKEGWSAEYTMEKLREDTTFHMNKFIDYKDAGNMTEAYFHLGILTHYITDSWTPSHAVRNDKDEITLLQIYSRQDKNAHHYYDDLYATSSYEYNKALGSIRMMYEDLLNNETDASKYFILSPNARTGVTEDTRQKSMLEIFLTSSWEHPEKKGDKANKHLTINEMFEPLYENNTIPDETLEEYFNLNRYDDVQNIIKPW